MAATRSSTAAQPPPAEDAPQPERRVRDALDRLVEWGAALMTIVTLVAIIAVVATYIVAPTLVFDRTAAEFPRTGATWVRLFAAFVLAFFPGSLLVRFIALRESALWSEFVINLHRLGVDRRAFLPCPPEHSEYYGLWKADRKRVHLPLPHQRGYDESQNLYRLKFEASYGRESTRSFAPRAGAWRLPKDTKFPVVLATSVFAVGWTTILSDPNVLLGQPLDLRGALGLSFAGAYVFIIHSVIRRYFQNDLKSSAYVSAYVRVATAAIAAAVAFGALRALHAPEWAVIAVSFSIGFMPIEGLAFLRHLASRYVGLGVRSLDPDYPLSLLDGMNVWYEARLVEAGIETLSDLVNATPTDLLLHTRVPCGRLVDWLDQAHLWLHLPAPTPAEMKRRKVVDVAVSLDGTEEAAGAAPKKAPAVVGVRDVLRNCGISNASGILAAFGQYTPVEDEAIHHGHDGKRCVGYHLRGAVPMAAPGGVDRAIAAIEDETARSLSGRIHIRQIVRVLGNDTSLVPVLNWRQWGAERMHQLQCGEADEDTHIDLDAPSLGIADLLQRRRTAPSAPRPSSQAQ